jgi:hypothetical protein
MLIIVNSIKLYHSHVKLTVGSGCRLNVMYIFDLKDISWRCGQPKEKGSLW